MSFKTLIHTISVYIGLILLLAFIGAILYYAIAFYKVTLVILATAVIGWLLILLFIAVFGFAFAILKTTLNILFK